MSNTKTLATWFTPSLKVFSRSKGHSVVAAAAYRACANLEDFTTGTMHKYANKGGLIANICYNFDDPEEIWNLAEQAEKRKNSTLGRELMLPLPCDFSDTQNIDLVKDVCKLLEDEYGVAVMASIHNQSRKGNRNKHGHILFSARKFDKQTKKFGDKTRVLDEGLKNGSINKLRLDVCRIVNEHAEKNGHNFYVYAGKFSDIDESHIPTLNIPNNTSLDKKNAMQEQNIKIVEAREVIRKIKYEMSIAQAKVSSLKETISFDMATMAYQRKLKDQSLPEVKYNLKDIYTKKSFNKLERRFLTDTYKPEVLISQYKESVSENKCSIAKLDEAAPQNDFDKKEYALKLSEVSKKYMRYMIDVSIYRAKLVYAQKLRTQAMEEKSDLSILHKLAMFGANLVGRKTEKQIEYEMKLKKINQECMKYDNHLQKMLAWLSNDTHKIMHEEFISNTTLQYLADPNKFKDPEPEEPDYNTSPDSRRTVHYEYEYTTEQEGKYSWGIPGKDDPLKHPLESNPKLPGYD